MPACVPAFVVAKMGLNYCIKAERDRVRARFVEDENIKLLYAGICPIFLLVCLISIIFNALLVKISRQSKFVGSKSPILLLSLNLALTDVIASLCNALTIFFNSLLITVFRIEMNQCSMLTLEVVRCAALIASALHLLALAFVHYGGIVKPLHYR